MVDYEVALGDEMGKICETLSAWAMVPLLVAVAFGSYLLLRFLALPALRGAIRLSPAKWDDVLLDRRVLNRLSLVGPALIFRFSLELPCGPSGSLVVRVADIFLILGGVWAAGAIFKAVNDLYQRLDIARSRPIEAYLELLLIALWILALVLIVANTFDLSLGRLLAGVGAMTAVLFLVFRDTILSMVASIQLINNNLIAIGDEIDVPDLGLNGIITDIELHTITIRGSDKKVTSLPTNYLTSHAFKNWRGIDDAGGRHLRRSFSIDVSTIRFLTSEEVERFRNFAPLADYMAAKLDDQARWNEIYLPPAGMEGDPRRFTNIGTFRAYVLEYIKKNPLTETDNLKVMVRQLQPTPQGLPIEIYLYSIPTDQVNHEKVAADLIDHILAMVPEFGLRVHQEPSNEDVRTGSAYDLTEIL